jgi:hypothetical protein
MAEVGIFWGIPRATEWEIIKDATQLEQAELYGAFLTHSRGHYEVWEAWKDLGAARLRKIGLPGDILDFEYEQFPRGRIVFDTNSRAFTIYADRKLRQPSIIKTIVTVFGLSIASYHVRADAHYRS